MNSWMLNSIINYIIIYNLNNPYIDNYKCYQFSDKRFIQYLVDNNKLNSNIGDTTVEEFIDLLSNFYYEFNS